MADLSADELKQLGNAAFQAGKYDEAIKQFSEAISVDPDNHVLYSNRSAAFASKKDFKAALADADRTVELKSDWAKGYGRRGAALHGAGRFEDAVAAYNKGLEIDASNKMLQDGLAGAKAAVEAGPPPGASGGMGNLADLFGSPANIAKLKTNPKTAAFFQDPSFEQTLKSVTPESVQTILADQRMMACLGVVMGVDIQTGDPAGAAAPTPATKINPDDMVVEDDEEEVAPAATPAPTPKEEPKAAETEPEIPANKREALEEKAKGTAAYKAKDFETALQHYGKAAELDPTDPVFLLNQGAVHFETKDFEKCREVCTKAKEVGMDHQCDFKVLAKADARIAKSYQVEGNLEDAIKNYDRALTNNRCPEYLNAKKKLEKELREQKRLAYIDPVKAQEAKERGNAHFKSGKFPEAIKEYSEAIKRNPEDGKLYSNRAAAYTKLAEFAMAVKDCDECIRLEPNFIKGYLRKGNVQLAMKKVTEAQTTFRKASEIDANHPEVREGLQKCQQAIYGGGGISREERAQAAMSDPEVRDIIQDPVIQSILQQCQDRPEALREHMKNDAIRKKIEKLAEAGILEFR